MKFAIFLCLILAGSAYAVDEALTQDLLDFANLLDTDKFQEIALKYFEDPEFLALIDYVVNNDEFKEIIVALEQIPEYIALLNFLEGSGLDVYGILTAIHEMLGLPPPAIPEPLKSKQVKGGMHDLIDELREILPKDAIKALHEEKLQTSTAFQFFVQRMTSDEFFTIISNIGANAEIVGYMTTLISNGFDVEAAINFSSELLGFM